MSTNLSVIKEKLKSLQESTTKTTGLWKPSGKHQIRIVPYKYNKQNPFIELYFHYSLQEKNYLSPKSFGQEDPIATFAETLRRAGDQDSYKLSRQLTPKLRTYLPIVERGYEKEGVKFWGFGKNNYEEILQIMSDEEYGDIADPINGTDLEVTFTTPEDSGTQYGKVSIRAKRSSSKLSEDPAVVQSLLNNQKNITDVYKLLSQDELKVVLENYLNSVDVGEGDGKTTSESESIVDTTDDDITNAIDEFAKLYNQK